MDFIFQDDSADIIRRELMAPRVAIVQSLFQAEPSKQYMKMAQICYGTIDDPHSPGGNSLGCKKETTTPNPVNIGNGNPAINPHPQGNFEPVNLEDVLNEELTECKREQSVDEAARTAADEIKSRSGWYRREYGAAIYVGLNGVRVGEIFRGDSDSVDIHIRRQPGEVVAAIIHGHPRGDVGAPSDDDWDNTDMLISRGLTDGDNLANYIIDGNNGELNEFDNNDVDRELDAPNRNTRDNAQGNGGVCENV